MSNTVLYMSMSLDGFIAGPDDSVDNPLGLGGERLHDWLSAGESAELVDEMLSSGAVLAGRRTYDLARGWGGSHHGAPVFVITHRAPATAPVGESSFTFVTDGVESAVKQAKAAAGDRDVMLHGASVARQCLSAGLLDEIQLHLVPVLLGEGRPLFDQLARQRVELELRAVRQRAGATHLRYRVVK